MEDDEGVRAVGKVSGEEVPVAAAVAVAEPKR